MPLNGPKILNQDEPSKRFTDEGTDKRIHEHLSNQNDVISEDDIRNVKTSFDDANNSIRESVNGSDMVDDKLVGDDLLELRAEGSTRPEDDVPIEY